MNRFDVEKNRLGIGIAAEIVEHVAEIDIRHLAHRQEMRKADAVRAGIVQNRGTQRTGLRHESQPSLGDVGMGETGIEADARHQQADRVGPQYPQAIGARGIKNRLLQGPTILADGLRQPGGQDHHRPGPQPAQRFDRVGHGLQRRADHRQIRRHRQAFDIAIGQNATDGRIARIDRHDRPAEPALQQIAHHHRADTSRSGAGPR